MWFTDLYKLLFYFTFGSRTILDRPTLVLYFDSYRTLSTPTYSLFTPTIFISLFILFISYFFDLRLSFFSFIAISIAVFIASESPHDWYRNRFIKSTFNLISIILPHKIPDASLYFIHHIGSTISNIIFETTKS